MNEAVSRTVDAEGATLRNPALNDAFRRAAEGIGSGENPSIESVTNLLRSRGIVREDDFRGVGDPQKELGGEIGSIAAREIIKNTKNGGTIKLMDPEKPPQNTQEQPAEQPAHPPAPEKQERINKLVVDINILEAAGKTEEASNLDQELKRIYSEPQSFPEADPLADIDEKIENLKRIREDAFADIKDPTKSATEPVQQIQTADREIKTLNKERADRIERMIANAPAEELRSMVDKANKILLDNTIINKTEAVQIKTFAEERLVKHEAQIIAPETPDEARQERIEKTKKAGTPDTAAHIKAMEVVSAPAATETAKPPIQEQQESLTSPAATEAAAKPEEQEKQTPFEKAVARIKAEDPAHAERLLNAIVAAPEMREKIQKLLGAVEIHAEKIEEEKKSKEPYIVERARKAGEWYRKLPLKDKLLVSGVLVGSAMASAAVGGATAGVIASAALVGSLGQRALGGLAVAVAVEGIFTKRTSERGITEKEIMGMRMSTVKGALAGLGVFVGGKLLGEYLGYHAGGGATSHPAPETSSPPQPESSIPLPEELTSPQKAADLKALEEYLSAKTIEEKAQIAAVVGSTPEAMDMKAAALERSLGVGSKDIFENIQKEIYTAMPLPHEAVDVKAPGIVHESILGRAPGAFEATHAVHSGENLWHIIKEKFPEIQALDGEGRQSNAIANIIDKIKADPENFGISSGDVDHLTAGDKIDLQKIKDVLDHTKITTSGHEASIIERASALTDTEAARIVESNAVSETAHHAAAETVPNGLSEITKDYTLSMPDAGGKTIEQLSAEALTADTNIALYADIQTMFGSKGLFGYGFLGTSGERSVDWLDFKDRAVSEVLSRKFEGAPLGEEGGVTKFGIDSITAVDKMKGYINLLMEKSGLGPEPGEHVEIFAKRALSFIIKNQ